MKALALSLPLAWLALFFWVSAYEIGMLAALLSFIGLSGIFLVSRHLNLKGQWILATIAAIASPIAVVGVISLWEAIFPPPACVGDECVQVTIRLAPEK